MNSFFLDKTKVLFAEERKKEKKDFRAESKIFENVQRARRILFRLDRATAGEDFRLVEITLQFDRSARVRGEFLRVELVETTRKEQTEHFHAELLRHRAVHDEGDERRADRGDVPNVAQMRVNQEEVLVDAAGDEKQFLRKFDQDGEESEEDQHRRRAQFPLEATARRGDRRVTRAQTFASLARVTNVQDQQDAEQDENAHGQNFETDRQNDEGDLLEPIALGQTEPVDDLRAVLRVFLRIVERGGLTDDTPTQIIRNHQQTDE